MTNKEAIDELIIVRNVYDGMREAYKPCVEAIDMAISALQAQDSPKPKAESVQNVQNEDLISRNAAIEALGERPMVLTDDDQYALGERNQYDMNRLAIETLPSAQPEPLVKESRTLVKDLVKDTISRQATIDALVKAIRNDPYYDSNERINGLGVCDVMVILNDLPSAQPEPCEDAVSRDSVKFLLCKETCHPGAFCPDGFCREICEKVDALPSATPKQRMGEWIPVSEKLPEKYGNYLISIHGEDEPDIGTINPNDKRGWSLCDANGFYWASDKELIVTAWMPLPEPYRAERRTDERFDRTAGGDQEAEENGYSSIY